MMVKVLAPMEEVSPFKLGQIQILISDVNAAAGIRPFPYLDVAHPTALPPQLRPQPWLLAVCAVPLIGRAAP